MPHEKVELANVVAVVVVAVVVVAVVVVAVVVVAVAVPVSVVVVVVVAARLVVLPELCGAAVDSSAGHCGKHEFNNCS
jgi:hypothetical protein